MKIIDLRQLPYNDAWAEQERAHGEVLGGGEERILLVEHAPVITLGRRPNVSRNLIASDESLAQLGVQVVQSDRGGDITFHGPGQLVAYPIIRLIDHQLSVGGYVRALEQSIIATLAEYDIAAGKDACAIGVWVKRPDDALAAKIAAIGVRIRRGVTLHGLALNVTTDLRYFDLIVPCGLANRPVTSMHKLLGGQTPSLEDVKPVLAKHLERLLLREHATLPEPAIVGEGKPDCASRL
jgi:lipoyl(octanoyl) transferase